MHIFHGFFLFCLEFDTFSNDQKTDLGLLKIIIDDSILNTYIYVNCIFKLYEPFILEMCLKQRV